MSAMSDYLETKLIQHTLDITPYTAPSAVYVALYTAAPSDAGGGTEASWTSYARQAATFSESGGVGSNSGVLTFPPVDVGEGPVTITHLGIFDAATAGNLLYHGALTSSKTLDEGDDISFALGDITVTLT